MSQSTKQFARHYIEMVVAMFAGMAILGLPAGRAMDAVGATSDAFMFLSMAATMTAGMVAWMIHRGHGRRANLEMSAAMFVPAFAAIGLLGTEVMTDLGALMLVEHVAMLLAMAGVMLLRPAEYLHHGGHAQVAA